MATKNFTVYKSSAGSGKTFTLVKEYLSLALNDASNPPRAYKKILAITFTNKAATEMKERILKSLAELSRDDVSSASNLTLINLLKSESLSEQQIKERSNRVLTAILHNYSDFAIGTIDSFVYKVVKTFAFDLKIPMNFDLELDDEKLLTQAIDMLIAQIGSDDNLSKVLIDFAESKAVGEKSWHIENDLKKFAKNLINDDGIIYLEKLKSLTLADFFSIKKSLNVAISQFDNTIKEFGDKALLCIKNANVEHNKFAGGANGIPKYFTYLSKCNEDKLTPSTTIQRYLDEDKWVSGKAEDADIDAIDSIKEELLTLYYMAQEYINANAQEITLLKLINTSLYSLAVLNEIEKLLNEYKLQNNIVHISEFNKMIAQIVMKEPVPFIYERLGEKYSNYLVDEFQDTSVLQFQNLLPLIDNSLAQGYFTMLVGDSKQAIYRWRGGEVQQFASLPNVYAQQKNDLVLEREEALVRNYNLQLLANNYRSKKEIVQFNNSFFSVLATTLNDEYKSIYSGLEQGYNEENVGGYIQIEFLGGEKEIVRQEHLSKTKNIVNELQADGYALKDIAILIRRNSDGNDIANYLSSHNIPVISAESLLLSSSGEVNFLFLLIKYFVNPDSEIIKVALLESFIRFSWIKEEDFLKYLNECKSSNHERLLQLVCAEFNYYQLLNLPLYELVESLIGLFGFNSPPNAYIQFFLDEVLEYTNRYLNSYQDFVAFWEERQHKASIIVPEGVNAVTIMTIHKSKGLEFPAVILPFLDGRIMKGKSDIWVDIDNNNVEELSAALIPLSKKVLNTKFAQQYEDELNKSLLDALNVMYVALTRPRERLYVLTGLPSKSPANISTYSDMFAHYLQTSGEWSDNLFDYQYGDKKSRVSESMDDSTDLERFNLDQFYTSDWRSWIKMRMASSSIWDLQSNNSQLEYGLKLHNALAKIIKSTDSSSVLEKMFVDGLISNDEKIELSSTIEAVVNHPELNKYFSDDVIVKNEAEVIDDDGKVYRPDRVVFDGSSAVVIDYKTGEEKAEHKKQVEIYTELIARMGYDMQKPMLVYVNKEEVMVL